MLRKLLLFYGIKRRIDPEDPPKDENGKEIEPDYPLLGKDGKARDMTKKEMFAALRSNKEYSENVESKTTRDGTLRTEEYPLKYDKDVVIIPNPPPTTYNKSGRTRKKKESSIEEVTEGMGNLEVKDDGIYEIDKIKYKEIPIKGDGNCLYTALAYHLNKLGITNTVGPYSKSKTWDQGTVRNKVSIHMDTYLDLQIMGPGTTLYTMYIEEIIDGKPTKTREEFIHSKRDEISRTNAYGDGLSIRVICELYKIPFVTYTRNDAGVWASVPYKPLTGEAQHTTCYFHFFGKGLSAHYNVLEPLGTSEEPIPPAPEPVPPPSPIPLDEDDIPIYTYIKPKKKKPLSSKDPLYDEELDYNAEDINVYRQVYLKWCKEEIEAHKNETGYTNQTYFVKIYNQQANEIQPIEIIALLLTDKQKELVDDFQYNQRNDPDYAKNNIKLNNIMIQIRSVQQQLIRKIKQEKETDLDTLVNKKKEKKSMGQIHKETTKAGLK